MVNKKDKSVERRVIDISDAVKPRKKQENKKVKKYEEPEEEQELGENDFIYDNRTLEKRSLDEFQKYEGARTRKDIPIDVVNEIERMKVEGEFFKKFLAWSFMKNAEMLVNWTLEEMKQVILKEGVPNKIKVYRLNEKGMLKIEADQPNDIEDKDMQVRWHSSIDRRIKDDVWRLRDIYIKMHEWIIDEAVKEKREYYKAEVIEDAQEDINRILEREKEKREKLISDAQEIEKKRLEAEKKYKTDIYNLNYKITQLERQVKDLSGRLNFLQKRKMRKEKEIKANSYEQPVKNRVKIRKIRDNLEGFGNIRKWK